MMYLNDVRRYANILSGSNNILAIEYLKALKKIKSNIKPYPIERKKVYYNDEMVVDEFASATAIRKLIAQARYEELRKVVPKNTYMLLKDKIENGNYVIDLVKFEKEIL